MRSFSQLPKIANCVPKKLAPYPCLLLCEKKPICLVFLLVKSPYPDNSLFSHSPIYSFSSFHLNLPFPEILSFLNSPLYVQVFIPSNINFPWPCFLLSLNSPIYIVPSELFSWPYPFFLSS